jgi:hypothetical protein
MSLQKTRYSHARLSSILLPALIAEYKERCAGAGLRLSTSETVPQAMTTVEFSATFRPFVSCTKPEAQNEDIEPGLLP